MGLRKGGVHGIRFSLSYLGLLIFERFASSTKALDMTRQQDLFGEQCYLITATLTSVVPWFTVKKRGCPQSPKLQMLQRRVHYQVDDTVHEQVPLMLR